MCIPRGRTTITAIMRGRITMRTRTGHACILGFPSTIKAIGRLGRLSLIARRSEDTVRGANRDGIGDGVEPPVEFDIQFSLQAVQLLQDRVQLRLCHARHPGLLISQ